jgi:hypothetical protein
MKVHASRAALVLLLAVSGCTAPWHKDKQAQQAPLAPPVLPANPPPPSNKIDLPPSKDEANIPSFPKPQVKPPAQAKHPRKNAQKQQAQAAAPATPVQQAAAAPAEVSAIGVLGAGDTTDTRNETQRAINDVERGLNSISRKMNDQEQRTAALIRENLKQARSALASGDPDGAHTLAVKARVLLGELNP